MSLCKWIANAGVRFVGPRSGWSRFADLERADALFRCVIVERWNGAAVLRLVVLRGRVSERALCVASTHAGSRHDPSSLPVMGGS